jgi:hypothetical protein
VRAHTRFIEGCLDELAPPPSPGVTVAAAAMAAFVSAQDAAPAAVADDGSPAADPWDLIGPVAW